MLGVILSSVRFVCGLSSHHQPFTDNIPPYVREPTVDEEPCPFAGGVAVPAISRPISITCE